MRQVTVVIGLAVIIFISGLTIMSINSKSIRKDELEVAVATAAQQTVKSSEISSEEDMMAYFIKNLFMNIKADGDIGVEFMGVDCEKGLLDVKVTEKFYYPSGTEEKICVRKTAILE